MLHCTVSGSGLLRAFLSHRWKHLHIIFQAFPCPIFSFKFRSSVQSSPCVFYLEFVIVPRLSKLGPILRANNTLL